MSTKSRTRKYKISTIIIMAFSILLLSLMFSCSKSNSSTSNNVNLQTNTDNLELLFKDRLVAATVTGYMPFEYIEDGQIKGFDIDVAQLLADSLGLKFETILYNLDGLLDNMTNPNQNFDFGICALTITKQRSEKFNFTEPYYTNDVNILLTAKPNSNISENNLADYINQKKVKIGVIRLSSFKDYILEMYPNAEFVEVEENDKDLLDVLDSGKVDLIAADDNFINDSNKSQYKIVKNIEKEENIAIAVAKNKPNLLAALNEVIKAKKDDSSIKQIYDKYFSK